MLREGFEHVGVISCTEGGISTFSINLENDGYTTISSLFNPDYRYTITGNQRMVIIGYAGYFTWESK